jgi:ATP-dependent RNA helicase DDX31/DBP7
MDPFAFNGSVVGLESSAPPLKQSRTEQVPVASARAQDASPAAASSGPFSIDRVSAASARNANAASASTAQRRKATTSKDENAGDTAAAATAGKKKSARVATNSTASAAPAASASPLKSALKKSSASAAPVSAPVKAKPIARQTANIEGLLAATTRLLAPPITTSTASRVAAPTTVPAAGGDATADEYDAEQAAFRQQRDAEQQRKNDALKEKVHAAQEALRKRQKMVSTRAPEAGVDPEAARDKLFGAVPPPAASASAEQAVVEKQNDAPKKDSDDDDSVKDAIPHAAVAPVVHDTPAGEQSASASTLIAVTDDTMVDAGNLSELLHPRLLRCVVEQMGITQLTRVQRLAWAPMTSDADVLIRSETGSGKTLAYGLPMLHALLQRCDKMPIDRLSTGTVIIVMTPTRELAEQCSTVLSKCLHKAAFVVVGAVHGGEDRHKEKARLRKGVHVLVCTPGRLLDHLETTSAFAHNNLHTVVMDEADRLLDMGFERSISTIMQMIRPKKRVLVSATITHAVERLSHFALKDPIKVGETEDKYEVPSSLRQHYAIVPTRHRFVALTATLLAQLDAAAKKIIVFVSTADATEFLYLLYSRLASPFAKKQRQVDSVGVIGRGAAASLKRQRDGTSMKKAMEAANRHVHEGGDADFEEDAVAGEGNAAITSALAAAKNRAAEALASSRGEGNSLSYTLADEDALLKCNVFKLHGNMTQVDRSSVFNAFRTCDKGVLFCTDVAARGLDMPSVNWIIHLDPPTDDRSYIHRIGRTARIGSIGDSLLFLMEHEVEVVPQYLAKCTNAPIREKSLAVLMYHLARLDNNATSWADSAAKLQHAAEMLVKNDDVLQRVAMFAYRSMIRAYAAYPREMKPFFDASKLHLGHLASAFAINATPTELRNKERTHVTEDRNLGRDKRRLRKDGGKIQLDTRETYHSTLATKASRQTKDWIEHREATGGFYKGLTMSKTAEFDA